MTALPAKHSILSSAVGIVAFLLAVLWGQVAEAGRMIVDSAGRKVEVPDRVARVMAAGPPASVLVYVLAPDKLIGWNRKPSPEELPYLAPAVRDLPEIGRLTGRGGTANLETVLSAKPDVIVDFGSVSETYVSLADRIQNQTGIPYVLIDGSFAHTASAVRLLGDILGVAQRAEQVAQYTEKVLDEVDRVVASVPVSQRPRVYLARGGKGLETGNRGSINTEIIERAGAVNVVDIGQGRGALFNVSLEQVLSWNPDTIIMLDQSFFDIVGRSPGWDQVEAVRRGHVYLSPRLPYGWIDAPPSLNRLMGLQWLLRRLLPHPLPNDVRAVARDFYKLFYQVDLSDPDLDRLLVDSGRDR